MLQKAYAIYQVKLPALWLVEDVCSDSHDAFTIPAPVTLFNEINAKPAFVDNSVSLDRKTI